MNEKKLLWLECFTRLHRKQKRIYYFMLYINLFWRNNRQMARFTIRNTCDSTKIAVILNWEFDHLIYTTTNFSSPRVLVFTPAMHRREASV